MIFTQKRLRRHFNALPGHIVFPAVIGAAQSVFFIAAEPQRHAAMGAEFIHQPNAPFAVAKGDQPLGHQLDANWRTIRLRQLGAKQRRDPVPPKQGAHGCSRSGLGEKIVLLGRCHVDVKIILLVRGRKESIETRHDIALTFH